jgi:hypothetical protein
MAAVVGLAFWIDRWERLPWKQLPITSEAAAIPRICPNCLAPGEVELRYGWHSLVYIWCQPWVGTYQTFYYCPACAETARAHLRYRRWLTFFSYVLTGMFTSYLVFGTIAALIAVAAARLIAGILPAAHAGWISVTFGIALGLFLFGLQFRWLSRFMFRRQQHRAPQQPGQAVWGLAAYWLSGNCYTAARDEWLVELARLNPRHVSDTQWQAILGTPKPAEESPRPFVS